VRVAFLGTGKMAGAMARRVAAAGHDVLLWNRTASRASAVGTGTVMATPADAAAEAELVLLALTGPNAVESVIDQVLPAAAGKVFVDMTTAGAHVLERSGPRLEELGAWLIVAPVFGSLPAVEAGKLLIMVGEDADPAAFERARPVLESFGEVTRVPTTREAVGIKLLVNAMLFVSSLAAAELVATGTRSGVAREHSFAVLTRLAPHLAARSASFLESVHEPVTFRLADVVKDLDLALEHFRGAGASMPVTALARELYAELAGAYGDAEMTAVIERYL